MLLASVRVWSPVLCIVSIRIGQVVNSAFLRQWHRFESDMRVMYKQLVVSWYNLVQKVKLFKIVAMVRVVVHSSKKVFADWYGVPS